MGDYRLLLWLRWRQLQDTLVYGLRLLGYEPGERFYALYLGALLLFWALSMASFSFDAMVRLGTVIPPADLGTLLAALPVPLLVGQVYVWVSALQTTPLKLNFPDMAYAATAPVRPAALILPGFVRQVSLRLLLLALPVVLLSTLLAHAIGEDTSIAATLAVSGRALLPALLLVLFTWGLAWLTGILRLAYPAVGRRRGLWALPLLLLPLALLLPEALLFAGHMVIVAAFGQLPAWVLLFMVAVDVLLLAGVLRYGRRINLTHAMDESQLYARLQSLGLMAYRQADVQLRIRRQSQQAGRRAWLRLPRGLKERQIIMARAALTYLRHPLMLVMTAAWGAIMTLAGLLILEAGTPIQLVIGWVLVAAIAPPAGLLYVFRADVEEKFLRQLLPVDGVTLLFADVLLPLLALISGGLLVLFTRNLPPDPLFMGATLIFTLALIQTLCGAYGVTKGERALQMRLIASLAAYGTLGVGYSLAGVTGLLIGGALVIMIVMGLLTEA